MSGPLDAFTTATGMLAALRARQLSAVELLELHQRRHELGAPDMAPRY